MDTTQTHDVHDERTRYADIIVGMTETHNVWIPGSNVVDDNDWVKWTILARCCVGQGWAARTPGLGLNAWVYVVGPASVRREDWRRMPLVLFMSSGNVIGVAVQPERIMSRYRRVIRRRRGYQDLAYGEFFVASGHVRPWEWGPPGVLLHVPEVYDRYCVRFHGSRMVYHVIHVRHQKKNATLIRAVARADSLSDAYWSARRVLGSKRVKLFPFRV